nr:alpha/beta hydrolases superfamily protein [Tanacetum cinerariifolium]
DIDEEDAESSTMEPPSRNEAIKAAITLINFLLSYEKITPEEGFSIKNFVKNFLRALHPKWRAKVMENELSKYLSSLALEELIGNLKVHEVVMKKDSEIYEGKKERVKSIVLKAKKGSSDDETSMFGSDDEEYVMVVRNFKKFFRRKGTFKSSLEGKVSLLGNPVKRKNHSGKGVIRKERVIGNDLDTVIRIISLGIVQSLHEKIKRRLLEVVGVTAKMKPRTKPTMKLVSWLNHQMSANSLREMLNIQKPPSCKTGLGFDKSNTSSSETKPISFVELTTELAGDGSTIKAYGSTIPGSVDPSTSQKVAEHVLSPPMSSRSDFVIVRKKIIHNKIEESKKPSLKPFYKNGLEYGSDIIKDNKIRVEESLNVTFDKSPPSFKLSPLVDDDVGEEEGIENNTKVVNNNNIDDESIEVEEVVNIKESKNHPLEQVIGNLIQRTLRSQAQNQIPLPKNQSIIGAKWVYGNKLDENGIVSRNKARLVAQGYN